jgi:hypothetical protein
MTLNRSLHGDLICFEQFCSDSTSSHLDTSHPCREAPLEWMQLCLLSHGAQLGWEGPSSPFPVTEESITHQIIDRPAQGTEHKVTFIICSSLTPLTNSSHSLRSFYQTGRYLPSLILSLPSSYRRHTVQGQGIRPATVGVRLYQRTDPLTSESLFHSNQPCSCLTPLNLFCSSLLYVCHIARAVFLSAVTAYNLEIILFTSCLSF